MNVTIWYEGFCQSFYWSNENDRLAKWLVVVVTYRWQYSLYIILLRFVEYRSIWPGVLTATQIDIGTKPSCKQEISKFLP